MLRLTAVEVEHYFEACASGPADGVVEDGDLALDVGVVCKGGYGPVADGDADVVHARFRDVVEVGLGDPGVPVLGEAAECFIFAQSCTIGVFVDGGIGSCFEDGGCNPGFENEPAAEIHTADFLIVVVEGECPSL